MRLNVWITSIAAAVLAVPGLWAQGTNDAEIACREEAARYARTERLNVGTDVQSSRGGFFLIEWQVRDGRNTYRGTCQVDRNSRVQRIDQTQGPDLGGGQAGGAGRGGPGGGRGVSMPTVNLDTSGQGSFSFGGPGRERLVVDRGYVDTRSRASVSLRVDGRKLTFYGTVIAQNSDREFDLRIDDSSEGRASGNARFRLNRDRNEVEMISVDGQLRGSRFDGTFGR